MSEQRVKDEHGRTFVEGRPARRVSWDADREFFVTIIDGPRTGYLLGPYDTHGEALGQVERGRQLANKANDRACWYAYGTASATRGSITTTVFGK